MPHSHVSSSRITLRPLAEAPAVGFPLPHSARPADAGTALGDWLDLWMGAEIEPHRAVTTVNGYRNIIRKHMRPALGAVRLSGLTHGEVLAAVADTIVNAGSASLTSA